MTAPCRAAPTVPGDPAVRLPLRPRAVAAFVLVLVAGWNVALLSHGVEGPAEIDPTGGLRSRAVIPQGPALGVSREELVRQWDLDGNGTIDASEANVARARMRRSRLETELGTGIDPLTGKPRVVGDEVPKDAADEPAVPGVEAALEPRPRSSDDKAPPGTRVPVVGPTLSGTGVPRLPSTLSSGSAAAGKAGGGRAAAGSRPASIMGGTRAGAPAARSGYGSLAPKPDLNAGLPRPAFGRPSLSGTNRSSRGGFMPSVRSPIAPRPTTPPAPSTPRVTADEIGGF